MTRQGRLGIKAENQRDRVEQALFGLCSTLDLLDEVLLRMHQAMNRTSLVEAVLQPGVVRLERVHGLITVARQVLRELWEERQSEAWDDQSGPNQ